MEWFTALSINPCPLNQLLVLMWAKLYPVRRSSLIYYSTESLQLIHHCLTKTLIESTCFLSSSWITFSLCFASVFHFVTIHNHKLHTNNISKLLYRGKGPMWRICGYHALLFSSYVCPQPQMVWNACFSWLYNFLEYIYIYICRIPPMISAVSKRGVCQTIQHQLKSQTVSVFRFGEQKECFHTLLWSPLC